MEAVKNVTIRIKYPVSAEFLDAAYFLQRAIRNKRQIDILRSTGTREDIVISNACDYYFPKDWIFAAPSERESRSHHDSLMDMITKPSPWTEPKPKTRDEMKEFFTDTFKDSPFMTKDIIESMADIFHDKGAPKTIKVEPKVLTREEWEKTEPRVFIVPATTDQYDINEAERSIREITFDFAHQNGRLEMWLEFKKFLVDQAYNDKACINHPFSLQKAVENLKPLKAE